jgi:hypothetical protein
MSQFDDIMAAVGIPKLQQFFGDPATVTPINGGSAISAVAIPVETLEYAGDIVDLPTNALRLKFAKTDYPAPVRGDRIVFKSATHKMDRVDPDTTNAYFIGVWVIPI